MAFMTFYGNRIKTLEPSQRLCLAQAKESETEGSLWRMQNSRETNTVFCSLERLPTSRAPQNADTVGNRQRPPAGSVLRRVL